MTTEGVPNRRVAIEHYEHKKSVKGEDFVLAVDNVPWRWGRHREWNFALFAVLDGHGGAAAAAETKQTLVETIKEALDELVAKPRGAFVFPQESGEDGGLAAANVWSRLLPEALRIAFLRLDEHVCNKYSSSGTTATVAVVALEPVIAAKSSAFWASVCVANVGDSHAFADFSGHIVQLNEDHRLNSNAAECKRVLAEGGEIARAGADKKDKSDPLRLWPGGLMMSRTLGDKDAVNARGVAAARCMSVRLTEADNTTQCTLRLILASDGLWDVVTSKQAFALGRRKSPQAASQVLASTAYTKAGKDRDDISVVVIDIGSSETCFSYNARKRMSSSSSSTSSIISTGSAISQRSCFSSQMFEDHDRERCLFWNPLAESAADDRADRGGTLEQKVSAYEHELYEARIVHENAVAAAEIERLEIEEALRISKLTAHEEDINQAILAGRLVGSGGDPALTGDSEQLINMLRKNSLGVSVLENEEDAWETVPSRNKSRSNSQLSAGDISLSGQLTQGDDDDGFELPKGQRNKEKKDKKSRDAEKAKTHAKEERQERKRRNDGKKGTETKQNRKGEKATKTSLPSDGAAAGQLQQEPSSEKQNKKANDPFKPKKKKGACFLFRKGQCKRGDKCRFEHALEQGEKPLPVSASSAPETTTAVATTDGNAGASCVAPDVAPAVFVSTIPTSSSLPTPTIPSFSTTNGAPQSSANSKEDLQQFPAPSGSQQLDIQGQRPDKRISQQEKEQAQTRPLTKKERKANVCFAFKRGSCKFGEQCQYKHIARGENQGTPQREQIQTQKPANGQAERPNPAKPRYHIFISGLTAKVGRDALRRFLNGFGQVGVLNVKYDTKTRGYAFCTFADPESAEKLLAQVAVQPPKVDQVPLKIQRFTPK